MLDLLLAVFIVWPIEMISFLIGNILYIIPSSIAFLWLLPDGRTDAETNRWYQETYGHID